MRPPLSKILFRRLSDDIVDRYCPLPAASADCPPPTAHRQSGHPPLIASIFRRNLDVQASHRLCWIPAASNLPPLSLAGRFLRSLGVVARRSVAWRSPSRGRRIEARGPGQEHHPFASTGRHGPAGIVGPPSRKPPSNIAEPSRSRRLAPAKPWRASEIRGGCRHAKRRPQTCRESLWV